MCIAIVGKPGCGIMNFEVKLIFLIEPFFLHNEKVVTKILKLNKEHFSLLLKDFQSRKLTKFFGKKESDFNSYFWYKQKITKLWLL